MRVLKGFGVGRLNKGSSHKKNVTKANIYSNFDQYGLERPEIFRLDSCGTVFNDGEFLDAIICDPPYGLRAGARQVGAKSDPKDLLDKFNEDNYKHNWHSVKDQMQTEGKYAPGPQNITEKSIVHKQKKKKKTKEEIQKLKEDGEMLSPKIIATKVSEVNTLIGKLYDLAAR